MEAAIIAARSEDRARAQHVRAFKAEDGYRVHSKSSAEWYDVTVTRTAGTVVVTCSCPGGTYYRDDFGNSCCKHAAAAAKRLLRKRDELAALASLPPVPAPRRVPSGPCEEAWL